MIGGVQAGASSKKGGGCGGGAGDSPLGGIVPLAFFLALAAGSFAYVATLDILRDELLVPGGRLSRWICVASGTGLMAALARWV